MVKSSIVLIFLCFQSYFSYTQDTCIVLQNGLKIFYNGKCKNGLAHGKGVAKGVDMYEGHFKKGYPDGFGKYIWLTGEIYEGFWKKGKMSGEGTYTFKYNNKDSTYKGIWREGKLVRVIKPDTYQIIKSQSVTRFTVKRTGNGNRVFFVFMRGGEVNNYIYNLHFAENGGIFTKLGDRQGFELVSFPFSCNIIYMSLNYFQTAYINVEFEIQINQPGEWLVTIFN